MNTIDMKTIDTNTTRAARRLAVIVIGALALSLAAVVTLAAETDLTGGFLAWLGDYLTEVGEALGSG